MIYISSDHRGLELKSFLLNKLKEKGFLIEDLGPDDLVEDDDFVDYAISLSKKVLENAENKGVLICKNGVGMSVVANRFDGIRAGLSWNKEHAASSRNDDGTNIITLPAMFLSPDEALDIVETWLNTPFENVERRLKRIKKIDNIQR